MNLGDLENRVSTAEQLLEVLDDNNEEEEDAEEVEAILVIGRVTLDKPDNNDNARLNIREDINRKKRFLSGIARMRGGESTHARIFGSFSISAFLVNKKSLFLQKCQFIELLTVF